MRERLSVNRVRVRTVLQEKIDLFYKALCATENKQIGSTDAENVKIKEIVSCKKKKRKRNARSEVDDCNRQVLRREREGKKNKTTEKIDARPTDQGSECV